MSILGWLEQVELRRIPAGGADFLILLISSYSSFVLYESFIAKRCCVDLFCRRDVVLDVSVDDFLLRVLTRSVLPEP